MAARPTWNGHLKLSLVTCPVALYTATSSASHVSFNLINPETNNRIRMVPTDPDTGPVERSELVKGYEVSKDEYVLFDDADFDKVRLESTRTISIEQFVDEDEIDRLYWDDPLCGAGERRRGRSLRRHPRGDEDGRQDRHRPAGPARARAQLALEVRGKGLVA